METKGGCSLSMKRKRNGLLTSIEIDGVKRSKGKKGEMGRKEEKKDEPANFSMLGSQ